MSFPRALALVVLVLACGDDDELGSIDGGPIPDGGTDVATDVTTDVASDVAEQDSGVDAALADAGMDVPLDVFDAAVPTNEDDDTTCQDGVDNDGDGTIDCEDTGCHSQSLCPEMTLRIVAANLTSGPGPSSYDPGHGIRILDGLDGDVFLVQEMLFGNNSNAAFDTFALRVCGAGCEAYRGDGELIPNGIVSRFPIRDAGTWDDPETDTREFAWARIDVPGRPDLWAVSIHLLTSSGAAREAESRALATHIGMNVPDGDHVVIGGDFNTGGGGAYDRLRGVVTVPSARPRDQAGNVNTNAPRSRILDGVLVSRLLQPREVPVDIGGSAFPNGLVVDTRVFMPLSAIAPAEVGDSGAEMMQHMAIVRDFTFWGL